MSASTLYSLTICRRAYSTVRTVEGSILGSSYEVGHALRSARSIGDTLRAPACHGVPIQCGFFGRKLRSKVLPAHIPDFSIIELVSYEDGLASASSLSIGDGSACFGTPWRVAVCADGDSVPPGPPGGSTRRV